MCVCLEDGGRGGIHTQKRGHVCCRVVAAVTNLPGPPDGSSSKVTEPWLDKHRSPVSISHPVHFGKTWLFQVALGPGKKKVEEEEEGGKEGRRATRET